MPKYFVEVIENQLVTIEIEASSEEEAKRKVEMGEGEYYERQESYIPDNAILEIVDIEGV